MPKPFSTSSADRARKLRPARWLLLIALSAISMTTLALTSVDRPTRERWLQWPVRILSIEQEASLHLREAELDDVSIRAASPFDRLRLAFLATPNHHVRENVARARRPLLPDDSSSSAPETSITPSVKAPGAISTGTKVSTGGTQAPTLVTLRSNLSYIDFNSAAYKRFKAWVDAAVAGNPGYLFSASDAALMYELSSQKKYCDLAVQMSEKQVSDAESVISGGSKPEVAGDSYLYAGPMIADVATTYKVCNSQLSASQRSRWAAYAEQTIWNIWNYDSAKWGGKTIPWSGWSVSNPGNNYYYSFLEATMSWALASGSQTWMDFLRTAKLPPLQAYFAALPGGGSKEGTGYGTSHMGLFYNYMMWRDSTGVDLANANSHVTDSIRYWVHATVPTLDRFAPIGDQSRVSVPDLYDYQRRLVLEARYLTYDDDARNIASWWLNNISVKTMSSGFNSRYDMLPAGTGGAPPQELVYLAKGTGNLFARTGWDKGAMWVAFIAGPYVESHAAQEQGGFTLFSGDWLAVTENIWTHSGIQQETPTHNVLRFEKNGAVVPQVVGTTSSMTMTPGSGGAFTADATLTKAYNGNSAVSNWKRHLDFGGRKLTVTDTFGLGSGTTATFQINVPVQPTVNGNVVTAGKLHVKVLSPSNPTIKLLNWKNVDSSEFHSGWRIDISGSSSTYKVELSDK